MLGGRPNQRTKKQGLFSSMSAEAFTVEQARILLGELGDIRKMCRDTERRCDILHTAIDSQIKRINATRYHAEKDAERRPQT